MKIIAELYLQLRANIPCHLGSVSCGKRCDRPLSCGEHRCDRICHGGDCLAPPAKCTQPCPRKSRLTCAHQCGAPCHPDACPAAGECRVPVVAVCQCGSLVESMPCNRVDLLRRRYQQSNRLAPTSAASEADRLRCLPCSDECARLKRNREFARALHLEMDRDGTEPVGGTSGNSVIYTDYLRTFAKANPKSAQHVQVGDGGFVELNCRTNCAV